jgi:hypothetical protein
MRYAGFSLEKFLLAPLSPAFTSWRREPPIWEGEGA